MSSFKRKVRKNIINTCFGCPSFSVCKNRVGLVCVRCGGKVDPKRDITRDKG